MIFHYLLCWVPLNWYFSLDTFLTLFPIYSISITLKFDIMWLHRLTWLMPLSYKLHSHSFVMLWQHLNIKTSLPPFQITRYRHRNSHTCTHPYPPMNTLVQNPLYEHIRKTEPTNPRDWWSHHTNVHLCRWARRLPLCDWIE